MNSELSRTELSCLITHKKGFAFKSKDYIPSGVPVVRVSNFTWDSISTDDLRYVSHEVASSTKVVQLNEYDVIVATVGSWPQNPDSIVGKVVRVPCSLSGALLNQNTVRLRVSDDNLVNQKYLYIALKTKEFSDHLISKAQGSANQASITLSDIFSYAIPWGTYNQRKYIVNVIDSINDKIVIINQINQNLEQMAQALFKSWFVDFEPVKDKIAVLEAGGSQADATLAAMTAISGKDADALVVFERKHPEHYAELKATAELFPSAMQESELGGIPEGWYLDSIYEVANVIYGAPFKSKGFHNIKNEGLPLVRIRDLKDESPGVRTNEIHPKGYMLNDGDLIIGMDGEFKPYIWGGGSAWMNQRVCLFKPKEGIDEFFILNAIKPQLRYFELTATATTVIHLGKGDIDNFKYMRSSDALMDKYSTYSERIKQLLLKNKQENRVLIQLRDTLLPKLLSGEITLPEAEQAVSEAENV